jgi:hypothetical protein
VSKTFLSFFLVYIKINIISNMYIDVNNNNEKIPIFIIFYNTIFLILLSNLSLILLYYISFLFFRIYILVLLSLLDRIVLFVCLFLVFMCACVINYVFILIFIRSILILYFSCYQYMSDNWNKVNAFIKLEKISKTFIDFYLLYLLITKKNEKRRKYRKFYV